MTAPVASSPRATWPEVPDQVRAWVENLLGSPVLHAENQSGGFSPGLAARVRCADGTRAFVKAVGPALNPRTPELHRAEAKVAAVLPESVPAPRLLGCYDDGDWVALAFTEVDGRMPDLPWTAAAAARVLDALVELAGLLTPCPLFEVPEAEERLRPELSAYARMAADPPADLPDWEGRHLERLAELATTTIPRLGGDTLVHFDVRADNLLVGADGLVQFVDWPWATRGAPWLDSVLFAVHLAVHGLDPEATLVGNPLVAEADPRDVTGMIAGFAGMWSEGSRRPPVPGLPTIREFQRAYGTAALTWVRRRTGWN